MIFAPDGVQPEQCVLAHTYWQPNSGCIAIFHKYCCHPNDESIESKLDSTHSLRHITDMSKSRNAGRWNMIKKYCVLCTKTYIAPWAICYNLLLVRDMPPGAPARIYETRKYPFKGIDVVYIELEYVTALTEVSPVQPVQSNESAYAVAPQNQEIVCWGTQYMILWP